MRQKQLSERIGVDTSNLSKYLNARMPISDSFLNRIVVDLGVSKQWLVDGTGVPFAKSQPAIVDPQAAGSEAAGGTPVYDIDATAGTQVGRNSLFTEDRIMGSVNLPNISPDCRIVRVSGDSMSPVIEDGDYVAVREVANKQLIFWGQIYIVELDNFRVVKYVRRHSDPRMVVLRSENPKYDDMDVLMSDIRDMMLVQHILRLNTRM